MDTPFSGNLDSIRDARVEEILVGGDHLVRIRGRFYRPFRLNISRELSMDDESFEFLKKQSLTVVRGLMAYWNIRCRLAGLATLAQVVEVQAEPLWFPDKGSEPVFPKNAWESCVRGRKHLNAAKDYGRCMWQMFAAAESQAKDTAEPEWYKCPVSAAQVQEIAAPQVVEPIHVDRLVVDVDRDVCGGTLATGMERDRISRIAMTLALAPRSRIVTDVPDVARVVQAMPHVHTLDRDSPTLGVYGDFVAHSPAKVGKYVGRHIVFTEVPVVPSPRGYTAFGGQRGYAHLYGITLPRVRPGGRPDVMMDLYVDFLRPGEIYAVGEQRAVAYMRVLWQMGYNNVACASWPTLEPGFIPDTSKAIQLFVNVLDLKYKGHVDMETGRRIRIKLYNSLPEGPVIECSRGSVFRALGNGDYVRGSVRRVTVKPLGGSNFPGIMFMNSCRVSIVRGKSIRTVRVAVSDESE